MEVESFGLESPAQIQKNLISLLQPPRILFSLRSNPIASSSPFAQTPSHPLLPSLKPHRILFSLRSNPSLSSSSSAAATDELGFRRPEFGREDLAGTVAGGVSAKRRGDDGGGKQEFQTHLTLVIFIHNLIALQVQHLNCRAHYDWI
uniref:Uncharacterized protein n=1 Tax=Ananas comosus var. bracteatus TaxID=296719 RepID=A0A6V7NJ89_ANACO|nr:unnamed protein product [Ananas comosus var. bracteatus]